MEARADIITRGFLCRGKRAFFDVRLFIGNLNAMKTKHLKDVMHLMSTRRKEITAPEF